MYNCLPNSPESMAGRGNDARSNHASCGCHEFRLEGAADFHSTKPKATQKQRALGDLHDVSYVHAWKIATPKERSNSSSKGDLIRPSPPKATKCLRVTVLSQQWLFRLFGMSRQFAPTIDLYLITVQPCFGCSRRNHEGLHRSCRLPET